jgi:hypothetical protein
LHNEDGSSYYNFSRIGVNGTVKAPTSIADIINFKQNTGIKIESTRSGNTESLTFTNTGVTGIKGEKETEYRTGNVNITPADIGLGDVNNTSDATKPVSAPQQTYIDGLNRYSWFAFTDSATQTIADEPSDPDDIVPSFIVSAEGPSGIEFASANNLLSFDNNSSGKNSKVTLTVSADPPGSADSALNSAKTYVNTNFYSKNDIDNFVFTVQYV